MRDRIHITEADFERLRRLVDSRRAGDCSGGENLDLGGHLKTGQ